ncbi:trimethylguanosine synthase-like isoform X2 [Ananas comosus]|uniref:Trimethylguanosine synthase n=1 Tax=Ananas comosus TaxID=4615 RepID=A0A6P5G628_ANACO|nr:trimethylguanosine synthase-like isoform X2 [Ananas comosus]
MVSATAADDSAAESLAIRKLGRLFKLTEVHLWDSSYSNSYSETYSRDYSPEDEPTSSCTATDVNSGITQEVDGYAHAEDLELACQMDALGLPVSFSTSKEKKNVAFGGKKKGKGVKSRSSSDLKDNTVPAVWKDGESESVSPSRVWHDFTSSPTRCDASGESARASPCKTEEIDGGYAAFANSQFCDKVSDEIGLDHVDRETKFCGIASQSDARSSGQRSHGNGFSNGSGELCEEGRSYEKNEEEKHLDSSLISHDTSENCGSNDTETLKPCSISVESPLSENHAQNAENSAHFEFGDWRVIWDAFYERNYFYNVETRESTWYPPSGLEDFALSTSTCAATEEDAQGLQDLSCSFHEKNVHDLDKEENNVYCEEACNIPDSSLEDPKNTIHEVQYEENVQSDSSTINGLDYHYSIATTKKKKRVRRLQSQHTFQGVIEGLSTTDISKYWIQRYSLFSRFDYGIKMDEEGWFSVTPEPIARHHASRCGSGTIIDCFTGAGGNAIQFAMKSNHVIAIDVDPTKIECAQHNAAIYGVNDQIDFIIGDFFQIARRLKGDTVFMSPPWGGPDYVKVETYDIRTMLKPCDGYFLFKIAMTIASRIVMFLPRNVDLNQLAELSLSVDPPCELEVEKSFLNGKFKAITAYFKVR